MFSESSVPSWRLRFVANVLRPILLKYRNTAIESCKRWRASAREMAAHKQAWKDARRDYFEELNRDPHNPRRDQENCPGEGWRWERLSVVELVESKIPGKWLQTRNAFDCWLPPDINGDEPEIEYPLPLPENRDLTTDEIWTVLVAIHDATRDRREWLLENTPQENEQKPGYDFTFAVMVNAVERLEESQLPQLDKLVNAIQTNPPLAAAVGERKSEGERPAVDLFPTLDEVETELLRWLVKLLKDGTRQVQCNQIVQFLEERNAANRAQLIIADFEERGVLHRFPIPPKPTGTIQVGSEKADAMTRWINIEKPKELWREITGKAVHLLKSIENKGNATAPPATAMDARKSEEAKPPPDPYAELRKLACTDLKGLERSVLEALCAAGGELPLADVKVLCEWQEPIESSWNSLRMRLNKKLESLAWKMSTHGGAARLKKSNTE